MRLAAVLLVLCGLGLVGYGLVIWSQTAAPDDPFSPEAQAAEDSAAARDVRAIRAEMDSARAANPSDEIIGTYAACGERCTGERSGAEDLVLMPEHPVFEGVYVGYAPPNGCLGNAPLRWSRRRDGFVTLDFPDGIDTDTFIEVAITDAGALGYEVFSGVIGQSFAYSRRMEWERSGPARPDACGRSSAA